MASRQEPQSLASPPRACYQKIEDDNGVVSSSLENVPPASLVLQQPGTCYATQGYPQQRLGYPLQDNQTFVMMQPGTTQQMLELPQNHSVMAWLTCLFCCWPIGLIAVIKSKEVDEAISRGDFVRARNASDSARKFANGALGFGIGFLVFVIVILTSIGLGF